MRALRMMSSKGDEVLATYDETTTPDRLKEIEDEFNAKMAKGYFAADLDKETLIREFDPNANIMLIPRVQGGSRNL